MDVEMQVLKLAERQYGVFADRQLRAVGGDWHVAQRRIARGVWERATRRVLRVVGSPASPHQRTMIAILDAGPDAVASHESAAWLWELPGFVAADVVIRPRSHGATVERGHRPTLLLPNHRTE